MELYALSINGYMFYFAGDIPEKLLSEIDKIVKEIRIDMTQGGYQAYCDNFIVAVKEKFKIELCQKNIEYVFRK